MRAAVIPILIAVATGCGIPVDIGMLDGTTGGSSGVASDDATLTESMTGPQPTMSMTSDSSSESSDPPPQTRHDFAIIEGPAIDTGGDTEGGTGTASTSASTSATSTSADGTDSGDPVDGSMRITATTGTASCSDPFGIEPCPATWTYSFTLPPDLQFVGAAGRLEDFDGLLSEVSEAPVECSFGGGTLSGEFEIAMLDDTHVAGRMFDLELTMWETEIFFDATICTPPD